MINITNKYYIFGAGTDIGKTVFASSISYGLLEYFKLNVHYIKPVDTGGTELNNFYTLESDDYKPYFKSTTFFQFSSPVSPHRVANKNQNKFYDPLILEKLHSILSVSNDTFAFIEGAGGVASPTLDGDIQCALYAPFKLPVIFVADPKLGGISNTISNLEFARQYGFEVACILCFESEDENTIFLEKYYKDRYPVFAFKSIHNTLSIEEYWQENSETIKNLCAFLIQYGKQKSYDIKNNIATIKNHVWWPLTQHQNIKKSTYIDSAHGDFFSTAEISNSDQIQLTNKMDATQSWWTQTLGHGHAELAKEMAHAAGRYGHIMFPGYSYAPVANLIQSCLQTIGKGWADRVFFSDNGSTAIEVALKMAFRYRFGKSKPSNPIVVLGLKHSYHGDTLAAMDATEPSAFTQKELWYNGKRGIWLSYPEVYLKNNKIKIRFFEEYETNFATFHECFDFEKRDSTSLKEIYENYIEDSFQSFSNDVSIGACLFEGFVLGAGGMRFIDPLYLKLLAQKCKKVNIPLIIDDIFVGIWRLGFASTAQALDIQPDIACFAKGITGGVMPLALTLAGKHIYEGFLSNSLSDALMHSHSYNGNPIAAAVATRALDLIQQTPFFQKDTLRLNDLWDWKSVKKLSELNIIKRCFAMGTVFAIEFEVENTGYFSEDAMSIIQDLKQNLNLEIRPLGNVIYIIAQFNSKKEYLDQLLTDLYYQLS